MTQLGRHAVYASLRDRNFRLFFAGQLTSSIGTWLHHIAESWLVYQISGSGLAVGLVAAFRFLPTLTLGLWGGAVADRYDKRRVLYVTQSVRAVAAALLAAAVFADIVTVPIVLATALVAGAANAVDSPVRRAFLGDLVDDHLILNAVSLNSMVMAMSRVVGPLLAGVLIATVGTAWCFVVNAVSYVAVLGALAAMDGASFRLAEHADTGSGSIREGLAHVRQRLDLKVPLMMVAVVSAFAWNWEILLTVYVTAEFGGEVSLYTTMFAVLSVGTFVGALVNASRTTVRASMLVPITVGLALAMLGVAATGWLPLVLLLLAASGVAAAMFNTASNAVVQVAARGVFHGRVIAVYSTLFVGMKGIGGVAAGALAEQFGARRAIAVSALFCLASAVGAASWMRRIEVPR